ncbi:hypothetical protein VitviT2T_001401 [Vitis vinifera]|uniref:Amino acid transporter transmembrane domain-containing protein n=2 Tax=Vitis vinifera TaxID=29760 RepID=A0ABY9BG08_VITVI|nr:hypothetical protein VitviT2T_001401 [Vitis vinifera]
MKASDLSTTYGNYSTIASTTSVHKVVQPDVQYTYTTSTTTGRVFTFFSTLGDVAFVYADDNMVLEIQATIPSTPEKPSEGPMWKGIYAMPVFDIYETLLVKKLNFMPCFRLRLITCTLFVAFTMFIGMLIPFFSSLLGFLGELVFAPTTYFLPCIMWLAAYKPRRFSLLWFANWICIVLGIILMILAPIGALRQIILQAKTFKLFLVMIFPIAVRTWWNSYEKSRSEDENYVYSSVFQL